jgi:hypothetical protein
MVFSKVKQVLLDHHTDAEEVFGELTVICFILAVGHFYSVACSYFGGFMDEPQVLGVTLRQMLAVTALLTGFHLMKVLSDCAQAQMSDWLGALRAAGEAGRTEA